MLLTRYNVFKQNNSKKLKVIFAIYIIAFLGATGTHIMDIVKYGFLGYPNANIFLNIYWTSLTLIDPLVVILLLFVPLLGLVLGDIVIITNVGINVSTLLYYYSKGCYFIGYKVPCQILFMIFVLVTVKYCWREIKENI